MDTVGFVFGMMGFIFGMAAMSIAISASGKIDKLEQRLNEAGILNKENATD